MVKKSWTETTAIFLFLAAVIWKLYWASVRDDVSPKFRLLPIGRRPVSFSVTSSDPWKWNYHNKICAMDTIWLPFCLSNTTQTVSKKGWVCVFQLSTYLNNFWNSVFFLQTTRLSRSALLSWHNKQSEIQYICLSFALQNFHGRNSTTHHSLADGVSSIQSRAVKMIK